MGQEGEVAILWACTVLSLPRPLLSLLLFIQLSGGSLTELQARLMCLPDLGLWLALPILFSESLVHHCVRGLLLGKQTISVHGFCRKTFYFVVRLAIAPWSVSEMSPWRLTSFELSSSFSCRVMVFWSTEYCSDVGAMMKDTLATMVAVVQGRSEGPTSLYLNAMIFFSVRVLVTGMVFGRTSALENLMASKGVVSVWNSIFVTSLWSSKEHSSPLLLKPLYRTMQQTAKITFLMCLHVLLEISLLKIMAPPGQNMLFLRELWSITEPWLKQQE